MTMLQKGFLSLVAWLIVGFVFTELTVLALNAWVRHETQRHEQISIATEGRLSSPD
jgi:hypothetical protein